ncbi:hypothetical protein BTIS_1074 [Bifidobacterium tissieri]|uniref:Uncharacterized protein n=1 Tax=Bifidobacterium tissieri TaxID=1630162 RepID=A0A261FFT3_9BIFI|nr:hypothetical protein [Bifidobacterium tissieri]OZG57833.1 hypothetical protein BTIS_1074 [Bifidobacterium tissieri]
MTRSRTSAKAAGQRLETQMEQWLQWAFQDDRIVRSRLHGKHDQGDIVGLRFDGDRVCIECKATRNGKDGAPRGVVKEFGEAITEAGNIDSPWPVLIKKRDQVGDRLVRNGGSQLGIILENDYYRLCRHNMTGFRPSLIQPTQAMIANDLVGMPCSSLFRLFNHGLPLGPE